MVVVRSDETTTNFQQATLRHIPQSQSQRCKSLMLDQKVHVWSDRTEHEESLGTQTTCASGTLATASPARIKCSFNYLSETNLKNLFLYKRHAIYFNILE
jgi:hypothetical protein